MRYRNPIARVFLIIGTLVLVPVSQVGGYVFGVPQYFGWVAQAGLTVFVFAILYVLWSYWLFMAVEIGPGQVVLRAPFRRIVLVGSEVERIELTPPVTSLDMEIRWWEPWSKLVIHRRGRASVDASVMPDGLKLRIANALDSASYPLPSGRLP